MFLIHNLLQDSLKDSNVADFEDVNENWYKSEIFRIFNCTVLEVVLKKGKDGIADQMDGKLLLIEQIAELELTEFLVGVDPNIGDRGRVNNFKIILDTS